MPRIMSTLLATSLGLSSCASLPISAEAEIHFETRAMTLPADLAWNHLGRVHELIKVKEPVVFISGGAPPRERPRTC